MWCPCPAVTDPRAAETATALLFSLATGWKPLRGAAGCCSVARAWCCCTMAKISSNYPMLFTAKGAFFSESKIGFSNLPISQKNYSKILSWAWNLNFLSISVNNLFKFQAQNSFLEQFLWEIGKTNLTFWKKSPLYQSRILVLQTSPSFCVSFSQDINSSEGSERK